MIKERNAQCSYSGTGLTGHRLPEALVCPKLGSIRVSVSPKVHRNPLASAFWAVTELAGKKLTHIKSFQRASRTSMLWEDAESCTWKSTYTWQCRQIGPEPTASGCDLYCTLPVAYCEALWFQFHLPQSVWELPILMKDIFWKPLWNEGYWHFISSLVRVKNRYDELGKFCHAKHRGGKQDVEDSTEGCVCYQESVLWAISVYVPLLKGLRPCSGESKWNLQSAAEE